MKIILLLILITLSPACSVGNYYVFSDTDIHASHTKLYEHDGLQITLFHFDGKSSAILLSSKTDKEISIESVSVSIVSLGEELKYSYKNNIQRQLQLKSEEPEMISFGYTAEPYLSPVTEKVIFYGTSNGKDINISKKYTLVTKSYGWFDALQGI